MIDFSRTYFELFGLPPAFGVDTAVLDRAYRRLQTEVHPDRFAGGSDAEKRVALQSSAHVNEAYLALKDPLQRARYLLSLQGIDALPETDTRLSVDFLERQLARREAAEDAAGARDEAALARLVAEARAEARELEARLATTFAAGAAPDAARTQLRELTFVAKLADDLDAMIAGLDP
jgi:molecular chaperone HscB